MGSVKIPEDLVLQATIMAVREEIMSYFKGTCVQKLSRANNVRLKFIGEGGSYQYQRRLAENEAPCRIYVGNVPILTVKRSPDRITIHNVVLQRSPQFKTIRKGIVEFMEKFLTGVEVEVSDANYI